MLNLIFGIAICSLIGIIILMLKIIAKQDRRIDLLFTVSMSTLGIIGEFANAIIEYGKDNGVDVSKYMPFDPDGPEEELDPNTPIDKLFEDLYNDMYSEDDDE